jgi:hypothetical protein
MSFDPDVPEQLFEWVLEEISDGHETPEVLAAIEELKSTFARIQTLEEAIRAMHRETMCEGAGRTLHRIARIADKAVSPDPPGPAEVLARTRIQTLEKERSRLRLIPTHEAADAFWAYWRENGETHRHGYYDPQARVLREHLGGNQCGDQGQWPPRPRREGGEALRVCECGRWVKESCPWCSLPTEARRIVSDVVAELARAQEKHAPMHSAHEGYAVILEELDELWDEVKAQKPERERMRKEALQVAAMGLRFVIDVCALAGKGE